VPLSYCRGILIPKGNAEHNKIGGSRNYTKYYGRRNNNRLGHVERMSNERVPKIIYKWKPYATRPKGRPRLRWEDDVKNDLGRMGTKTGNRRRRRRNNGKK
jgi:hypothetical protein